MFDRLIREIGEWTQERLLQLNTIREPRPVTRDMDTHFPSVRRPLTPRVDVPLPPQSSSSEESQVPRPSWMVQKQQKK